MKTRNLKSLRRLACFALSMLMLICTALPCFAAGDEAKIVKVGFFAFEGYHQQDENGIRSGYGYEILQHMAGYGNFRYEYIGYDKNWSEMQEMLANGEIDILTSAQKTPEREERFDFSKDNIGISYGILTVRAGDEKYSKADYENWNGIRVGMLRNNSRNASFEAYALEKGFTYESVFFDSTEEMVGMLKSDNPNKTIDAVVTSNLRKIEDEWIIADFDSSPFYIMVQKGNEALLESIDSAISQVNSNEPGLYTELMNKYYTPSSDDISFTLEERNFIKEMEGETLTALINPDFAPYSWVEDGKLKGIFYEVAEKIISRTGLNITFLDIQDRESYWEAIETGAADIRFDVAFSYNQAEKDGFWLTMPYMSVPISRVFLKDTTDFKTACVPENHDIDDNNTKLILKRGMALEYYASVDDAVYAVLNGERNVAYLAMDSATMAVRDDYRNKLVSEEVFGEKISYAAAVSNKQSPLVYSIINKAVVSLEESDIDEIRQSYAANLERQFTLIGYIYDNPISSLVFVSGILLILILAVIAYSQSKHRKEETEYFIKEQKQNELLKDALSAAEKAGAAKSQFLSRVSHEMRTPLNAIIGFIELAKGAEREQMEDYLASSDLAAKQLLSVINDVLDMSSIESGKMKISSAPFNFKHLISSITNIYGTQCKQKGIDYQTKVVSPTEDWLIGDELRLNQILMNLLGNSVKFTQKGHIWLVVSEISVDEEKTFLRFEISDSGCGMSPEMMERLFMPFEQENAATAKKYGGSGLGLSIVKNLVGMMDGQIKAESIQGEGTTFTVDLPFGRSKIEHEAVLPKKAGSLRILAVDDEKTERDYIQSVLGHMGVRYSCVESGTEALAELEKSEKENDIYNVCLVDWRMPELDGIDTTSRIREKYGKDVVVIVVSAYDFQQASEAAKRAGANFFVSKPLFQSSLFDLLMSITGGEIAETKEEERHNWDFVGKRVLLAEDNTLNQIVAKGYLAKYNVVVDVAENGKIAYEKFSASEQGYYDAILMDIQMPVMDGFEATKAIRSSAHPDAKTVPIIAQTADAFNEDIAKSLSAGMNAHVAKPIKPEVLAKELLRAFSNYKKIDS